MNLRKFRFLVRLVILALLALPVVLRAEDTPVAAKTNRASDPNTISVDFPGGPLSKLVASLASQENTRLSLIQSAGLDPTLPAFSVREARVESVVAALGLVLEPQGFLLRPVGPGVAVLTKIEERHGSNTFASFQLGSKLGNSTVEDVVSAIQAGCEFATDGKPSTLRFKFHPGTKLLFVSGTSGEVDIAREVFNCLPSTHPGSPPPQEKK